MKILLVDDSNTIRSIQKKILNQIGYTDLTEAEDGVVALQRVAEDTPDLILLDWNMPNMDGLTFLKEFRAQGHTSWVIMVTTEAEKSRVIEAIKAGVNNYVIKPFTPDELSDRIAETINQSKAG